MKNIQDNIGNSGATNGIDIVNCNPAAVREFLQIIRGHAAKLAAKLPPGIYPGNLQLVVITPNETEDVAVHRFQIGDVESMAEVAIAAAASRQNVYLETRTVRRELGGRARGGKDDTIFCFGLVVDSDDDHGFPSAITIDASIVVASSTRNKHLWILFDRPLNAKNADEIGQRLRAATKTEITTGCITTPFRVAGTPNYPKPSKVKRGRVTVPTYLETPSILKEWKPDELRELLPEVAIKSVPIDASELFETDVALIASALTAIPNAPPYEQEWDVWFKLTCALNWAAHQLDAKNQQAAAKVRELSDAWSRQAVHKFNWRKQTKTWNSLKPTRDKITAIETLYWIARDYKWSESRFYQAKWEARENEPRYWDTSWLDEEIEAEAHQ